ncbi:MAG: response regulator [Clostridiaceae bacterium]|nr:response regulator [Clostridiaceae bacterium]
MWKVLIVDDEPIIRKSLRRLMNWHQYDMEVVGEAGNGREALEIVEELQPNVVLVDICMPIMDGFQLIEKLNGILDNWLAIVISTYEEFSYAYRAVKLKAFDYLVKPVNKEQLHEILYKAKEELQKNESLNKQYALLKTHLEKSLPILRKKFIDDWIKGRLAEQEIRENLYYLKMAFPEHVGVLAIKNTGMCIRNMFMGDWANNLIPYAIQKIALDALPKNNKCISFVDDNGCVILIMPLNKMPNWLYIAKKIEKNVEQDLRCKVIIAQRRMDEGILSFPDVYREIMRELFEERECSPMLLLAKSYIDQNYFDKSLSLEKVASEVQASCSYLAKHFRKQLGVTFNQYLTRVRINEALRLMRDHTVKIYDISQAVGYNSQYYFSKKFKSIMGVSPKKYRDGITQ